MTFLRYPRMVFSTLSFCILGFILPSAKAASPVKPNLILQTGLTDESQSVAISQSGRVVATGNAHAITLWDRQHGWILKSLTGHSGKINSIAFSPDGNWLASGTDNGELGLWNAVTGDLKSIRSDNANQITAVSFASSNEIILSAGWDNSIRRWDQGACLKSCVIATTSESPFSIAVSPNADWLAVGTGHIMNVWKMDLAEKSVRHFDDLKISESGSFDRIAVAFGQTKVAAVSSKGTILMQDLTSWKTLWRQETGVWLQGVGFNPSETTVYAVGGQLPNSGRALSFDVSSGRRIPLPEDTTGLVNRFRSLAVSRDGEWLIAAGANLIMWNLKRSDTPSPMTNQLSLSRFADLSPGTDSVIIPFLGVHQFSLDGGYFRSFTPPTGLGDLSIPLPLKVAISPDGQHLATTAMDKTLISKVVEACGAQLGPKRNDCIAGLMQKLDPNSVFQLVLFGMGEKRAYNELGFAEPDAAPVFSADGKLLLWRRSDGFDTIDPDCLCDREHYVVPINENPVLAVSPDRTVVAANIPFTAQRGVELYKVTSRVLINKIFLENPRTAITALAFNPSSANGSLQLAGGLSNGDVYMWDHADANPSSTVIRNRSEVRVMAYSLDGRFLAMGNATGRIKIADLVDHSEVESEGAHSGAVSNLWFGSSNRWLASVGEDGVVRFWSVNDGRLLGTLLFPYRGASLSWLFVQSDGYFDGEPRAFSSVLWGFGPSVEDVQPVDAFIQDYYFHGLLKKVLRGEFVEQSHPLDKIDRRIPSVSISTVPDGTTIISQRSIRVKIRVSEAPGAGAKDVHLFENGVLFKHWHSRIDGGTGDFSVDVPISAGSNEITAYAFNDANVKSPDVQVGILGSATLKKKGTVYILGIGINKYKHGIPPLHYSVNDAAEFVNAIAERQGDREVVKVVLSDEDASRANILCAFSRLGNGDSHSTGSATKLNAFRPAEPEDTIYVLFSGHGISSENQFVILPSDSSTKKEFRVVAVKDVHDAISDHDLQDAFEPIIAREQAIVLDACGSGRLLQADPKTLGPINLDGFAHFAYQKGLYLLAAATANESALETASGAKDTPHSIMTYVLVDEGLKQNKAKHPSGNGISVEDWFSYAVQHVPNEANQQPVAFYPRVREENKTMFVDESHN